MKKIYAISLLAMFLLSACNDWLDVAPKDKVLEEDQYKTEDGIYSALNGLYRQLIGTDLYGGRLSQTTLDAMAHYYTYPDAKPSDNFLYVQLFFLGHENNYTDGNVTGNFSAIWGKAYTSILNINQFIKCVKESKAAMNPIYKDMVLGEAYGLRAYIHFDLFRLFGPRYEERSPSAKILPYNNYDGMILNHDGYEEDVYVTADQYFQFLSEDITKAKELLANDPIFKIGITSDLMSSNTENRNRRMNYYAVRGLEARMLQYMDNLPEAAVAAKEITDNVGKIFKWTSSTDVTRYSDYIMFSEVIFGINNLDMSSNGRKFYEGTNLRNLYTVDRNNLLRNIFGEYGSGDLRAIGDVRARQWVESESSSSASYSVEGTYYSRRSNSKSDDKTAIQNLQPLMRISEMYYIQAEAAIAISDFDTAAKICNDILSKRGVNVGYHLNAGSNFANHLEHEYYREFYGEGQIYFFHKRRKDATMFNGNNGGNVSVNTTTAYTVPIPDSEKNI